MISFRRRLLVVLFKLSDLCIFVGAALASLWFVSYQRRPISIREVFSVRVKVVDLLVFLGLLVLWHLIFVGFKLYYSRRLRSRTHEWKDVFQATTLGTALFIPAKVVFGVEVFTFGFIAIFWLLSTILTICFRKLLRYALSKVRYRGRNLRLMLMVGTNERVYEIADKIAEKKELGYTVIGYVDNEVHRPRPGVELLGTLDEFSEITKQHVIDEVVIGLPVRSHYEDVQRIIQKATEQGIVVRYPCLFSSAKPDQLSAVALDDLTVVTITSAPRGSWPHLAKRIMDVLISTALVIVTLPLMIVAAISIKLSSRGPVLFVQDRVGYNKRIFRMYKFRTMMAGAQQLQAELESQNEMDGPVFKIERDPRITRVGRWLRKTSIDELPQFFNVVKGDMSLVGPRPLPLRDYNGFSEDWQRRRFSVLPGITCTWQINGRNHISFEKWMKLDLEYIDHWGLSNDLKILLKTIPSLISRKGAK